MPWCLFNEKLSTNMKKKGNGKGKANCYSPVLPADSEHRQCGSPALHGGWVTPHQSGHN